MSGPAQGRANAPLLRSEAVRLACDVVRALSEACAARGMAMLEVGGVRVPLPRVARATSAPRIAARLRRDFEPSADAPARGTGARRAVGELRTRVVHAATELRWEARIQGEALAIDALSALVSASKRAPRSGARVLVIARHDSHLRDLVPVCALLARDHGIASAWLVGRLSHARAVARTPNGMRVLSSAPPRRGVSAEGERLARELAQVVRACAEAAPLTGLDARAWRDALAAALEETGRNAALAVRTARATADAFATFRPDVVLFGNPCILECAIADAVAVRHGVPSLAVQHGALFARDPMWCDVHVDRMCAWGPSPREALLACGFPSDGVVVTGAPWVDALTASARAIRERKTVLVALSGAGNQISIDEHLADVERIVAAAAALTDTLFLFRLHPKDDAEHYRRAHVRHPGARVEIDALRAVSIQAQLASADMLLTKTSASATDAILQGVPVVTLGRPPGEPQMDFVTAGATTHVAPDAALEAVLRARLSGPEPPATTAAARAFAGQFFGPLDGASTARVASEVMRLAGDDGRRIEAEASRPLDAHTPHHPRPPLAARAESPTPPAQP